MKKILLIALFLFPVICFGQWTLATNYPSSGVAFPFCFTISGKAYMGCGFNSSYAVTVTNNEFNPISNTWTIKSTPPFQARMGAFSFSIGGYGYVGSGSTNGGNIVLNDFWRYDPTSDVWTPMAAFPGPGRIEAATFVIASKAYVVSGISSAGNTIDCWEYDPNTNTWTAKNNPPSPFTPGYVVGFANANLGYVGMGGGNSTSNNDFWKFDPSANTWTQLFSLPANPNNRTWCVGGVGLNNGKGFVGLGGYSSYSNIDFWSYDFASNSWQVSPSQFNFPYALANARTFILNGEVYVGTGQKVGGTENKIYKYNCNPLPSNISNGLLAYYPFNSGSVNDFSGNGHHLTNTTLASSVSDRNSSLNCAFEFDNLPNTNNQFLSTSNTTFLNNLSEYSVSCWYKALDNSRVVGAYEGLVNRDLGFGCPDRLGQWSLGLYDCRFAVFGRENSAWQNFTNCDLNSNTGTWHHLTATYNQVGNTIKIYKDGILQNTKTGLANCSITPVANDIGDLFIGKFYTGVIDDIFIHNREISPIEVNQLFNFGSSCCQNIIADVNDQDQTLSQYILFPQPTNKTFKIKLNNEELGGSVKIYSTTGQLLTLISDYDGIEIDISNFNTGSYFVLYEFNGKIKTLKLIKSK